MHCTAFSAGPGLAATKMIALSREVRLASGELVYGLDAMFVVVGTSDTPLKVDRATSTVAFTCERAIPASMVFGGE